MKKKHSSTQLPLDLSVSETPPVEVEKKLHSSTPRLTLVKNMQVEKPIDNELEVRNRNLQRIVEHSKSLSW
jgi:hypothetical protein